MSAQSKLSSLASQDRAGRYLALVAEVAGELLGASNSASMVDDLFKLLQTELELDVFFNYRLTEDGRLALETYAGLTAAEAEAGAFLDLGQAVCGCVARDRKAAHLTAIQSSNDPLAEFPKGVGLNAYACTPLLHNNQLLGTLGFGRRWVDHFDDDELHLLRTVCHYVAMAKYRLGTEQRLREAVERRDRLLDELNHRVRNSLQLVIGLVSIEAQNSGREAREMLDLVAGRIAIVAAVHRNLYSGGEAHTVEVGALLRSLCDEQLLPSASGPTRFAPRSDMIAWLPVEKTVALALFVAESIRIGPNGSNGLTVALARLQAPNEPDELELTILGAGAGIPPARLDDHRLLKALAHQLRAKFVRGPADELAWVLRIPSE